MPKQTTKECNNSSTGSDTRHLSPPLLLTTDSVLPKSPSSSLNGNHQQGSKGTEDSEAQHLIGSGQTQGGLGGCEVETQ